MQNSEIKELKLRLREKEAALKGLKRDLDKQEGRAKDAAKSESLLR